MYTEWFRLCRGGSKNHPQQINSIIDVQNWVVRALNADWLTAVVYQTVYHGYDKTFIFYCSNYVGNQFITARRHLRVLWYMANMSWQRTMFMHSVMRRAQEQPLAMVYWSYTKHPRALLLKHMTFKVWLHFICSVNAVSIHCAKAQQLYIAIEFTQMPYYTSFPNML
jgi:hypothetical protein